MGIQIKSCLGFFDMMEKLKNKIEILFWKFTIYLIQSEYGKGCKTSDIEDFPETFKTAQSVFHSGRCPACRAKEVVDWIKNHIDLL